MSDNESHRITPAPEDPPHDTAAGSSAGSSSAPRRSLGVRIARGVGWTVLGLILLLGVLAAGLTWYSHTPDFDKRVRARLIPLLEDSTGGTVDIGSIQLDLWHLSVEVDNLVVHGLEGPGQAPYLSLNKLLVRLQLKFLMHEAAGPKTGLPVSLSFLRAEQPHIHLIIDKDGKTNQPTPKHPSTSTEPLSDTLLDLQAKKVELADGLIVVNDRAIPFDVAARNLQAHVAYLAPSDQYDIAVHLNDLQTKMAKEPELQSGLQLEAVLGRDRAEVKQFDFTTGMASHMEATGWLNHFAHPDWQAKVSGELALKQISLLAGVDGLDAGTIALDLNGHNCDVSPQQAQKQPKPRFWQHHPKTQKPPVTTLAPDPACTAGYLLAGSAKLNDAAYNTEDVRLHNINGSAQLHITPSELLFTALTGYLPGGGSATGNLRIENWLGEVPPATPATSPTTVAAAKTANTTAKALGAAPPVNSVTITPVHRAHAYLDVTTNKIPLRTILDITATKGLHDLGFDTAISGPVKAEWGGPATDIADSVVVDGDLKFTPTGVQRRGAKLNIPINGEAKAHYDGAREVVDIQRIFLQTPQTTLEANGVLGVNKGDPLTSLHANLQASNLGEFDQLLQTFGVSANGKTGSAALPVVLHGQLSFQGTATGALKALDLKGHLQAQKLEVKLGTQLDTVIDSIVADAEYSPKGVAVGSSTIKRNSAVLNLAGTFEPRRVVSRHGVVSYVWDDGTQVNATVKLADAQMTDVLQLAGQPTVPVTGTLNVSAHVTGTFANVNGSGNVSLVNGVAYGEAYQSVNVDATVRGQDIEATNLSVRLHGMQIAGNGGYDLTSKRLHAHIQGDNLQLSKFDTIQKANSGVDGVLSLNVDANGTVEDPGLKLHAGLTQVTLQGQPLGQLTADAHSDNKVVYYALASTLVGAQVSATGQTALTGDYQTQAKLTLAGLDISKPMALFNVSSVKATSLISGTVTVNGPAKMPKAMSGSAAFDNFSVQVQGIELKAAEPLRLSLQNGTVHVDQFHITGPDTDLRASGTAVVFGDDNPQGGALNVKADGSLNVALAHTFDPDIISSGKVSFNVVAGGRLKKPVPTGHVVFNNVNAAMEGIANGLSNLNGSLVFNEDRLQVESLTATTGGGKLKIGGYLTYQNGIFADLTVTGDAVRVRLNGLSTTATANLKLQGGPQSAVLSGTVLITRFGVGADVDFAAFAGSSGVQAPPDPNSPTNKIRLDVHVTSSPQLDFQNSYAKLAGTVDLTVRGTVAEPVVLGRIQITDGSATFAGTKYELQRGTIYFTNPVRIDPVVDLDATAHIENYDITVGVHGTSSNLKFTYRSEPPLSEADVFNLLALGRTQEEASLYSQQQQNAGTDPTTSALLGGALNATVSSRVSKLFGSGGSVKIDPAFVGTLGNSTARITVQQQLSRQITLVYATNVNESSQQLIQVQYQLDQNKSLVATRDETGVFSIVFKLRKRYR
jgi:translocation and assembly module TamB